MSESVANIIDINNLKWNVIFSECIKQLNQIKKNKFNKDQISFLNDLISFVKYIFYSLWIEVLPKVKESCKKDNDNLLNIYSHISLTFFQIWWEIIDILDSMSSQIQYWQHMLAYASLRMFKERILSLMVLSEKKDIESFYQRSLEYINHYQEFITKYIDTQYIESEKYYWWSWLYHWRMSISKLMHNFKIKWYSYNSYYSHWGYWTHLDCNLTRLRTDLMEYKQYWGSKELLIENYWIIIIEVLALTIDTIDHLKEFIEDEYYKQIEERILKLYNECLILSDKSKQ